MPSLGINRRYNVLCLVKVMQVDSFITTKMSFGYSGTATLILACSFLGALLTTGEAVLIRQFSSFLPLFGSLRHACLLGQKSSVECRYLGFNTEPFTYNKELAEEVLCYLKSYNRVTGRCRKGQRRWRHASRLRKEPDRKNGRKFGGPVTAATVMILIFDSLWESLLTKLYLGNSPCTRLGHILSRAGLEVFHRAAFGCFRRWRYIWDRTREFVICEVGHMAKFWCLFCFFWFDEKSFNIQCCFDCWISTEFKI